MINQFERTKLDKVREGIIKNVLVNASHSGQHLNWEMDLESKD